MGDKTVALSVVQQKALTIKDFIHKEGIVKQLEAALPRFLNADRFLRTIYSAMLQNPKLLDCTQDSLLSSMIQAAQLGLEPVLGKAALIPYGTEMQFQPMFRGLIDLAMRSDKLDKITAHTVYDKDQFTIEYGTDEKLNHKPFLDGDRGNIRGSYTVWYYKDGGTTHSYMSISDIQKIRDRSPAWKAFLKYKKLCPWNTDESEMCKKTVIKRHSKLQPCSVEFEKAVEYDNSLETGQLLISDIKDLPKDKEKPNYAAKEIKAKDETPEDPPKPTVDVQTGEGLEQGEPQGTLPDGVDPIEWLTTCHPRSSVGNAKTVLAVYKEQEFAIDGIKDPNIQGKIRNKRLQAVDYLAQIEANKKEIAEEKPSIPDEDKIPEFDKNNEHDEANGRLQYLKAMKDWKNLNSDIYASVLMDNSTEDHPLNDMNDVKPGDEQAILGFMNQAFEV